MRTKFCLAAAFVCLVTLLAGCSTGDGFAIHPQNFSISGTLTGLLPDAQLTVSDNSGDTVTLTANGPFSFQIPVNYNGGYLVAVVTQPAGEMCTVANYSGSGVTGDIANVNVVCSVDTYPIGGAVSGLTGAAVLLNNGGDPLTITGNGAFTFQTPVAYQGSYNVTVATQPVGQTCTVTNGASVSVIAPVTNVSVLCSVNTFTIGGDLSGLGAGDQITLLNNGADPLTVSANAPFTFATPVAYNGGYNVTIGTQPVGQMCSVSNGSGLATAINITNITVSCSTNTYTVGGTLSGLGSGLQVVLDNNGGDPLTLTTNAPFTFATPVSYNGGMNITVGTQPAGQTCTVNGGTVAHVTANVTAVDVECSVNTYTISGSISGLTASGLVLKDNGGDTLAVASGDTIFHFVTPIAYNSGYSVTVFEQPVGQNCSVSNASALQVTSNVTNVAISCVNTYTIGGAISGLTGTVVLQNNGGDAYTATANGSFTFAAPVNSGAPYNVTVLTQPATQTCTVSNGASPSTTANVTNVTVSCSTNTYTVGGMISGLTGTLVLQNNDGDNYTAVTNGSFTFATPVVDGDLYNVTIFTQPVGEQCTVSDGAHTIAGANVTSVLVNCIANAPTAASINPAVGPVTGGTLVTITGSNFTDATAVTFGGVSAASVVVVGSTTLTCVTPASAAGAVDVVIAAAGGSATLTGGFTYVAVPTATSISPATGPVAGGTSVTISGANFAAGSTSVMIGATAIPAGSVTVNSASSLTFTTPPNAAGNVAVTVTTDGGTSSAVPGGFSYTGLTYVADPGASTVSYCTTNPDGSFSSCNTTGNSFASPVAIAVNSDATYAYVLDDNGNAFYCPIAVDGSFGTCSSTGGSLNSPAGIVINPTGTFVYITNFGSNTVLECPIHADGSLGTCAATGSGFTGPEGMAINPAGTIAYIVNQGNGTVDQCLINGNNGTLASCTAAASGLANVLFIAINPAGTVAYVTQTNSVSYCTIGVTGNLTCAATTPTGSTFNGAEGVSVNPAGTVASVANSGTNEVLYCTIVADGDLGSCSPNAGFSSPSGISYSAPFSAQTFTVTPGGDAHVSISPAAPQTVNFRSTQAFTVIPNSGYSLVDPPGGTCRTGSFSGVTYITGLITADCTVSFSAAPAFTVGGTVSGLSGTVVLQDNGGDDYTATSDGPFTFSTPIAQGSSYNVTILTQPAGQTCTISNGSAPSIGSDVTNVNVSCSLDTTTMSASLSNLALAVTGSARTIAITNTGSNTAQNLSISYPTWPSGTTASTTCGSTLNTSASCTITVTPGATATSNCGTGAAPAPGVITVSADNAASSAATNVVVLTYQCIYQQGYIFAIDDTTPTSTSIGGKVAALTDQSSAIQWYNSTFVTTSAQSLMDGAANTATIIATQGIGSYAAELAANYQIDSDGNSPCSSGTCYSNWYLPAVCEMGASGEGAACSTGLPNMETNLPDLIAGCAGSGCLSGPYWSSTEAASNPQLFAWFVDFSAGGSSQGVGTKSTIVAVRLVRSMSP